MMKTVYHSNVERVQTFNKQYNKEPETTVYTIVKQWW